MSELGAASGESFNVDYVVVGSGFGGSVAALRLTEKGYSVLVLEQGRRFADDEMPKSSFDLRRYYWAPRLGLRGIFKLTLFKDVFVMSGAGVGGGSNVYAMTLYTPPDQFFQDPQWAAMADWKATLAPHFDTAQRMLGVTDVRHDDGAGLWLKQWAKEIGKGDTYRRTRVGAYLDTPGQTVSDPYFGGDGPDRTGCTECGRCMVGCPIGAKNATTKNYLWFAERGGARVQADRTVTDLRPLDGDRGATGWIVEHEATGVRRGRDVHTVRARGVVVAGGALGTNTVLAQAKLNGSLPHLSPMLGEKIRTNSESILAVTLPHELAGRLEQRVAISSSAYPDPDTHIETVVFGKAGDANRPLLSILTGGGNRVTRPLKTLGNIVRNPVRWLRLVFGRKWSQRTVIILVMQSLDNALTLTARRGRGGRVKLQTKQSGTPNPTFIQAGYDFARWLERETGGIAQNGIMESLANIPSTAHFLGGAAIAPSPQEGVLDADLKVYGYDNLIVTCGAAMPANVGVNPSLTITALAEHAMASVPPAPGIDPASVKHRGTDPVAGQTASGEPLPLAGGPH